MNSSIYPEWAVSIGSGGWLPSSTVASRIAAATNDPLPAYLADTGLRPAITDFSRKSLVSLAMHYIALPNTATMQAKRSYHYYNTSRVFWDSLWDFNIGSPSESAQRKIVNGLSKYAWSRRFTGGIVLLNYEASTSISFSLGSTVYRSPSSQTYTSSVTLAPYTALILKL